MFAGRTLIPMLAAADLDRARAFYADKLDLKPVGDGGGPLRYECGDSAFLVYPSEFAGTNQATAAMWEVDDIDGTVTALKDRGVEFQEFDYEEMTMQNSILTSPDGARVAWFFDSERNILGLVQPS